MPELWEQFITEVLQYPNSLAIGCGDYSDLSRQTYRQFLKTYTKDTDSPRPIDDLVRDDIREFYEKDIKRIEHRLAGFAEGNHYYEFLNNTTSTQELCALASVPYLEKPCFMRLHVKHKERTMGIFKILIHHGDWGTGVASTGADVNAWEGKAKGMEFDIYIACHTHRKWGTKKPVVTIPRTGELRVIEKPRAFIKAGCFVKTYVPCAPQNYAQRKLMEPTEPGYVRLEIQFYREYDAVRYKRSCASGNPRNGSISNWKSRFLVHY